MSQWRCGTMKWIAAGSFVALGASGCQDPTCQELRTCGGSPIDATSELSGAAGDVAMDALADSHGSSDGFGGQGGGGGNVGGNSGAGNAVGAGGFIDAAAGSAGAGGAGG